MMTLKTLIGSISSESKEYVERVETGDEDEDYEHTPDIDSHSSPWLSVCSLVGKPVGNAVDHFGMGSCFDFGLHSTSAADYHRRNFDDDVIASSFPQPPSLTRISSQSSTSPQEPFLSGQQEGEEVNEKIEREERSMALERTYVYDVYDQIAPYFRESRNRTWPKINQFLLELEPGSLVCDAGCGSGKYLDVNRDIFPFGLDRCHTLSEVAKERGHEVVTCDILALPFREESFDAAISISVIHHLATTERRVEAIRELSRVLRIGGRLVITVWAMEQRHRKFESQDVLVPWHKPVRVSSEDQTSVEKDVTSTTTNSDDDILNYHAYTSGSEPSVLSYPMRKRLKIRESWMNRHRFGGSCRSNRRSSSQSSSDLSSPNESCYSFLRRALQKLSWGSTTSSYKFNKSSSLFNSDSNSMEQFGCFNTFGSDSYISANSRQIETRNRLNAELDKQDSLDSNENADDIPIELYDVDGDQMYQVPQEVSAMRQRRGTSVSENNVTFKRRISQSFERTASLKDTVLSRRRSKSFKARLKRSASTDSPNSHVVTSKSRSLSDLLSLFSATFLQYSRKTSQDTTSGSSSSFTKHSSNSSVDSRGSRTVPPSKSNVFTLAKVEELNENYNSNNNNVSVVSKNNESLNGTESTKLDSERNLVVSLSDDSKVNKTTVSSRKIRPRSLILNRERVSLSIPRTLSVEDYQNGNHILLDFDSDLRVNNPRYQPQPFNSFASNQLSNSQSTSKRTRDMSTQFDYWSPKEEHSGLLKAWSKEDKKNVDEEVVVKNKVEQDLYSNFHNNRDAVDSRFIDRIIDRDHLFPSHSMPNLMHVSSSTSHPKTLKKRNSFVLLSSKAKYLMEIAPRNTEVSPTLRHPLNIKGFRRLSQPCMQFCNNKENDRKYSATSNDDDLYLDFQKSRLNLGNGSDSHSNTTSGEDLKRNSSRWASLLRRHSSFSVMKQCHQHNVIRHSYSTGDSNNFISDCGNGGEINTPPNRNSNNKVIIKEDSLQSDTSVDSDDSIASVIAVRQDQLDTNVKVPKRNSFCSIKKLSSKEGSDTSYDSEESCISVIANENVAQKSETKSDENVTNVESESTDEIDIKWEKYMDASESLALDSIFYVNILHQPEMESMLKDEDYYLSSWTNVNNVDFDGDYDIVGVASVEYHNVANKLSLAETCWLDSSSSCKSCDPEDDDDDDLLDKQLHLDIDCSSGLPHTSSKENDMLAIKATERLFDAAVDVANSLQSAVTAVVVSNQKCTDECSSEPVSVINKLEADDDLYKLNNPTLNSVEESSICSTVEEAIVEDDNIMNNSYTTNEMSMSISREEAEFDFNEDVKDSFEESQWRVREDVINGNVSQSHLKLFQKMLQNISSETSRAQVRRRSIEQRSHRRKSDSEATPEWTKTFDCASASSDAKSSISRGKSLEFYAFADQSLFSETSRSLAVVPVEEEVDILTKSVESSDNFVASHALVDHRDDPSHFSDKNSDKNRKRLKSQNNVSIESPNTKCGGEIWQGLTDEPSSAKAAPSSSEEKRKAMRQGTLSISTSEDSILSGSENCGSTMHHRYYHVFREGELDYLIENYVENLHIISSYYDHSSWCVIAEKVQVWKI